MASATLRVKSRDVTFGEGGLETWIDRFRDIGVDAFGGWLMVDGADSGVGFAVGHLKLGDHRLERSFPGRAEFEREVHSRFRLFFAMVQGKRRRGKNAN